MIRTMNYLELLILDTYQLQTMEEALASHCGRCLLVCPPKAETWHY